MDAEVAQIQPGNKSSVIFCKLNFVIGKALSFAKILFVYMCYNFHYLSLYIKITIPSSMK